MFTTGTPVIPGFGTGRKKALLIGINYHTNNQRFRLTGCINDVLHIYDFLTKYYHFQPKDIHVLTDAPGTPPHQMPTRANIIQNMFWLVEGSMPGDSFFLQFSGHGSQIPDESGDEDDMLDETLCPIDFENPYGGGGMIVDDEMYDILVKRLAPGAKLTALIDCCHSGTVLDLPYMHKPTTRDICSRVIYEAPKPQVLLFSGCADWQKCHEVPVRRSRHDYFGRRQHHHNLTAALPPCANDRTEVGQQGAMTACFIQTLIENNFCISFGQLLFSIREKMCMLGFRDQQPQLSYSDEGMNMDCAFVL
eukprot:GEZU01008547.1.p1 GENE.GEZU01008547.1~~GEZU01008547.1.p1  ORF type:complete len:306 (-),score=37.93 GEZU01008547.1:160-1077(-)